MYQQPDASCPGLDPCRSLEAALAQLQGSAQTSTSAEEHLGRWGLMDFSSSLADEAFSSQYYHHHPAPQPFCSPTTPGPSPQYPQTPTLSSPLMQPWEETRNLYPQTFAQSSSPSLLEYESYTRQHHPHQTTQLLMGQYELIQDQAELFQPAGLSDGGLTQEVRSSSPSLRPPDGPSWKEDPRRAAGRGPSDVSWVSECTSAAVSKKNYLTNATERIVFSVSFGKSHFCSRTKTPNRRGAPRVPSAGNWNAGTGYLGR